MSLLKSIQAQQIALRKTRSNADDEIRIALLTTLLGEASSVGKNAGNRETTDAETVAVVKKFLKNIEETLRVVGEGDPKAQALHIEAKTLQTFLPKQLDAAELEAVLKGLAAELGASTAKDMGRLMKELKARHDGTYDGGLASKLSKAVLEG